MSLLVFDEVSLSFGSRTILEPTSLTIAASDRVGLVGPNGSGKSSLLKLIAGELEPDGGKVQKQNGIRLGYLPQDLVVSDESGLLAFVYNSAPERKPLRAALSEQEFLLEKLSADPAQADALMDAATEVAELHERLSHLDLLYSEHQAQRILTGLGFSVSDFGRSLTEFSGGWKMRAVLAALIFQQPDLLLLDEPTNHLDMPSVAWFSSFLRQRAGAFILICHDREFLNEQINHVFSLEPEGLRSHPGNYEQYRQQRTEEEQILENRAVNLQKERERTEAFIRRFRAKASKATQVQSRVKALEKMETVQTLQRRQVMHMRFPSAKRSGNQVQRIEGVSHKFGQHEIFSGVDLEVRRGDRIAIIGINGAGKTTLLKIMAQELAPTAGQVTEGHHVERGYYAQHHTDSLNNQATVYEEVASQNSGATLTEVRTLLGAFLFNGDDVDKKISVLSGGERARVALARLLIAPRNYLLMDEPTNHLDLDSSEVLADALSKYDGTIVFVSHNRSFTRKLATKIWNVGDGKVEVYPGTLDEYLHSYQQEGDLAEEPNSAAASKAASTPGAANKARSERQAEKRRQAQARNRLSSLKKQAQDTEQRISALEARQRECNSALENPDVYQDDQKRQSILNELQKNASKLDELTMRWEHLQTELEKASL